jgi:hypothetical protein
MEEYHQRDEFSNSQISDYISRGPLYFYGAHVARPKLYPHEQKQVWEFGTAAHQLFSAPGRISEVAIEIPESVLNKDGHKKGQTWIDWSQEHSNLIQLKPAEMSAARTMVRRVYEHPIASKIFSSALHYEHTLIWEDHETGLGLRARPDIVSGWRGCIIPSDFKTSRALTPREFARDARKYGYHRQAAWYSEPLELQGYRILGFYFVTVDKSPAHECRVYEIDPADMEIGRREIQQARREIAERLQRDDNDQETAWRSELDQKAVVISLPHWNDDWSVA